MLYRRLISSGESARLQMRTAAIWACQLLESIEGLCIEFMWNALPPPSDALPTLMPLRYTVIVVLAVVLVSTKCCHSLFTKLGFVVTLALRCPKNFDLTFVRSGAIQSLPDIPVDIPTISSPPARLRG